MVLEVHLHDLIAQAEHYGVFGPHPLLHIDMRVHWEVFVTSIPGIDGRRQIPSSGGELTAGVTFLRVLVGLKVGPKMLHQGDLFVKLLGIVGDLMHLHHILLL